jgi:hypothetical protein
MTKFGHAIKLFAALALLAPAMASAQQYFDPGLFQKSIMSTPEDFTPRGARLGSFMLNTGAELGWYYNDNVFYLEENELSDSSLHLRPYAELRSDWNRHALNFSGWGDIARHDDFDLNDYEDWGLRADGRVDVKQGSWFSADTHFMHLHEDRRSPDSRFGLNPTVFDYSGYGFGYDHVFNRLSAGIYYNYNQFDYDNNVDLDGNIIDNQFRNREQDRITVKGAWQFSPDTSVFATYGWNDISYDIVPDPNGNNRNSDGYTIGVGLRYNISELLTGDVSANWNNQSYDDPALRDVDGFGLGAGLTWTPRQTTQVAVRMAASPQETTQPGTSGYFSQLYSVRWQEELRRNLLFNLRGSWTTNSYENPGLNPDELGDTDVYRADIGLSYLFNRNLYLSVGYGWEQQDSNASRFEYTANRYFLTLGVQL